MNLNNRTRAAINVCPTAYADVNFLNYSCTCATRTVWCGQQFDNCSQ